MHSSLSWLARVAVLSGVVALSSATDFDLSQLDKDGGEFGFIRGSERCPQSFSFTDDDFAILSADIKINGQACAVNGGVLTLAKNPDAGGTNLTEALRKQSNRDTSYEGSIGAALSCGSVKLVPGTYFQVGASQAIFLAHSSLALDYLTICFLVYTHRNTDLLAETRFHF